MNPVIVIRPQPACNSTVDAAEDLGLEAFGFPLFEVQPIAWEPPEPDSVDALLIGSANALRHAGAALSAFRGKPAYAVGEASAQAARAAELDVLATGEGGLQAVLELVQNRHRKLLRLTGETRVDLTPPEGMTITERTVYRSAPQPMTAELVEMLKQPALVLLHSGEAARHFAEQCDVHGIDRSSIKLAAMAPRIAEAAGAGWADLATAEQPNENTLLALARQMCQERDETTQIDDESSKHALMQDGYSDQLLAAARRPRTVRTILITALIAFFVGAGITAWLDWSGDVDFAKAGKGTASMSAMPSPSPDGDAVKETAVSAPPASPTPTQLQSLGTVEARLALLEDRLSRLNLEASAASGNAARAEGLLIAFAARRITDKGENLGYLEDQLKLRFADAQPMAVGTIIDFAKNPVTLDELGSRLDALTPELSGETNNLSTWGWIKQEFDSLFEVRRSSSPSMTAEDRIDRAKLMLSSGKVDKAIEQVERLPGAEAAESWIADARRYDAVQRALDLIETTAMLEPRRLQDAEGKKVEQPSPLATPAPTETSKAET